MDDWFAAGTASAGLEVPALFNAGVVDAFGNAVAAGALVSVGLSRDGGACGVTVTFDGRWRREWFRESGDLEDWLNGAAAFVTAEIAKAGSSGQERATGARNGRRRV